MKFGSTLFLASILGAFAGVQSVIAEPNLVVVTVTKTVTAQPVTSSVQPIAHNAVVTVTRTATAATVAAAAQATTTSVPQPVAHNAVVTVTQSAGAAAVVATTAAATSSAPAATTYTTTSSSAAPAETTSSSSSSDDWKTDMLSRLNAVRAAAGKSAVSLDSTLNSIAQSHSQYQSSINEMTHSDPSGTLGTRLSARSVSWQGAAENIAWNQQNVASVMDAWTKSSGHYANMIGDYNRVGFGVSDLYWTQDFIKA
ncbi:hypothetical protein LPJ53_001832 [Coemansia erecta]|uniref:SCP domain-containing protein n=1 Tax=Coemansia erecta TaxID=147472 RepID=A0A9W7Y388_9FUNG|nr:hypothetical protein LPJ53_001832 [Coemansia erecta]